MILVDLNQVLIAATMGLINDSKGKELDEDLFRHTILNNLRLYTKSFRQKYGNLVLCFDNKNYWRRTVFPHYKAGRKKAREASEIDWNKIFVIFDKIRQELKDNFPYKCIDVDNAEADDIIGTLAPRHVAHENVLILSSDGDFIQLQRHNKNAKFEIKQYNAPMKKYVETEDADFQLKEKIIRGDSGDGIPNIYSPADCFVVGQRQTRITKNMIDKLLNENFETWPQMVQEGYIRNQTLIDLSKIPEEIKTKIINNFEECKPANKQKMLTYFIEKRLKNLMDVIEEF